MDASNRLSCRALLTIAAFFALSAAALAMELQIVTSTYWGGAGKDELAAVAAVPGGKMVIGGTREAVLGGSQGRDVVGGRGVVELLDAQGRVQARQQLDGNVSDLDADATGIVATGSSGTVKFDAALARTLWTAEVGAADARVACGPRGGAAVLVGGKVTVLDAQGKERASFTPGGSYLTDVTYDARHDLVIVCGFSNKRGTPPGQRNYPVQVAFVKAFQPDGKQVWTAYDFGGQEVADLHLMADTRAYRVAIGGDGKLYIAGESAGGNTMWMQTSKDVKQPTQFVKGDKFQHAYNTAANHITAVVRMDPKTGDVEMATLLLARLSSGRGNAMRPRAIAADAEGNVYVGGASAFSPPKSEGSFGREGGGAYFVVLDRDFSRQYGTTLAGGATARGIAAGDGFVAIVGDVTTELATHRPAKADGDADGDGFFVLFSK